MGITIIDPDSTRFERLRYLNISFNRVTCLQNLPASLVQLQANFNLVQRFTCHPGLQTLGLVKNQLTLELVRQAAGCYTQLVALDLSHNKLVEKQLPEIIKLIRPLASLKFLALRGNEVCSSHSYQRLVSELPNIKYLDQKLAVREEDMPSAIMYEGEVVEGSIQIMLDEAGLSQSIDFRQQTQQNYQECSERILEDIADQPQNTPAGQEVEQGQPVDSNAGSPLVDQLDE